MSAMPGGHSGQVPVRQPQWPRGTPTATLAGYSLTLKGQPFLLLLLPLHYHSDSLKAINKYEKQLIFLPPPHLLSLNDSVCPA